MKVITNYEDLEGKTISFCHMAQFAEQITIATTDGEVLMASFYEGDYERTEIEIFNPGKVILTIQNSTYLQRELDDLGIFNLDEWKKKQMEKQLIDKEECLKRLEEEERREYERLKAKFKDNEQQ